MTNTSDAFVRAAPSRTPPESSRDGPLPWNTAGPHNHSVKRSIELASMAPIGADSYGIDPPSLWQHLRERHTLALRCRCRKAVVAFSLIGMSSMALVSLFQMGLHHRRPASGWRRP